MQCLQWLDSLDFLDRIVLNYSLYTNIPAKTLVASCHMSSQLSIITAMLNETNKLTPISKRYLITNEFRAALVSHVLLHVWNITQIEWPNSSKSKQTEDSWLLVSKVVASYQKQWPLSIPPQLIKQCVSRGLLCVPVCSYNLTNLALISARNR